MAAQATLLYRLQTIDLAIAKNTARLKEIEATLGQDTRVAAARVAQTTAESTLHTWQTRARDLELEIKSLADKIKTTENRLYGGAVTNPKELGDMQNEITSLQKRQAKLEDDNIESMLYIEQEQANVKAAQQVTDAALATFATSQSSLISEKYRLEVELATYLERRKPALIEIEPASLARYEALRPKKRGIAVAALHDGSCTVCGVEQTSMIAQLVRAGHQLVLCGSCGRILAVP